MHGHLIFRYIDISYCYLWDVATEDLLSALYELKRQTCFHSAMISMTLQALALCTFARVIVCIFLSSTFKRKHWIWRWRRERGTRRTPQQDGRERSIHPRGPEKCGKEMRPPFVSLVLLHSPPSPVPFMCVMLLIFNVRDASDCNVRNASDFQHLSHVFTLAHFRTCPKNVLSHSSEMTTASHEYIRV